MRKLQDLLALIRDRIKTRYQTVRVTSVQMSEQLIAEIKAINPDRMPAVLIVYESALFSFENSVRETTLSLVLIDRFRADSDERALSLITAAEILLELFPPDGLALADGVSVIPADTAVASADLNYSIIAQRIIVRQGT